MPPCCIAECCGGCRLFIHSHPASSTIQIIVYIIIVPVVVSIPNLLKILGICIQILYIRPLPHIACSIQLVLWNLHKAVHISVSLCCSAPLQISATDDLHGIGLFLRRSAFIFQIVGSIGDGYRIVTLLHCCDFCRGCDLIYIQSVSQLLSIRHFRFLRLGIFHNSYYACI